MPQKKFMKFETSNKKVRIFASYSGGITEKIFGSIAITTWFAYKKPQNSALGFFY
jgi:hypothetical protein